MVMVEAKMEGGANKDEDDASMRCSWCSFMHGVLRHTARQRCTAFSRRPHGEPAEAT